MSTNQPVITDPNVEKLSEPSNEDNSIKTELSNAEPSSENTPESVSTDMTPSNYSEEFETVSTEPVVEESNDNKEPDVNIVKEPNDKQEPDVNIVKEPTETPPLTVNVPEKTDNLKLVSKTQKQYDMIINQANNIRRQFTKKRKTMSTWDHNKKHEWRNKISDILISVIRQAKNKNTLKHHHGKLKSVRNLFNHYLNSLSTSKQTKKSRRESKSKK
jgi:hypothetical protein